jgi:hypothetical protein
MGLVSDHALLVWTCAVFLKANIIKEFIRKELVVIIEISEHLQTKLATFVVDLEAICGNKWSVFWLRGLVSASEIHV